jgi:hypothetical protein
VTFQRSAGCLGARATTLHVIKDLEKSKRAQFITFEKLTGDARQSKVLKDIDGTARGALNSTMKNLANLRKELPHADDANAAAAKAASVLFACLAPRTKPGSTSRRCSAMR